MKMKLETMRSDEIRHLALCAIAKRNEECEKVALENAPDCVPSVIGHYIEEFLFLFQCLSLFKQENGTGGVESLRAEFATMPFVEKMRLAGWGNILIVPGIGTHKPLNMLFFDGTPALSTFLGGGSSVDAWINALEALGFGGSVIVSSGNFPTCWDIASSGEVDVLLMHDDDGWSTKVGHFEAIQDELKKNGLPVPPLFAHGYYSGSEGSPEVALGKFLAKNFPSGK